MSNRETVKKKHVSFYKKQHNIRYISYYFSFFIAKKMNGTKHK